MSEPIQRVYCSKCIYFSAGDASRIYNECGHESNFKILRHDWYAVTKIDPIKDPSELNKKNNCKNYKEKKNGN